MEEERVLGAPQGTGQVATSMNMEHGRNFVLRANTFLSSSPPMRFRRHVVVTTRRRYIYFESSVNPRNITGSRLATVP
jgi:hypothetical protein